MVNGVVVLIGLSVVLSADESSTPHRWDYGDIRHYYAYDSTLPFEASIVSSGTNRAMVVQVVRMRAADGDWMDATLSLSKGEGPFGLFLGEAEAVGGVEVLVENGYLCARVSNRLFGERARKGASMDMADDLMMAVWSRRQTGVDYRRLLDYLFSHHAICPDMVVMAGTSRMGRIAVVTAACDTRIRAVIARSCCADWPALVSGPGSSPVMQRIKDKPWYTDTFFGQLTASIDPLHFARWLGERPVLVQSGEADSVVPSAAARRLADALGKCCTFRTYAGEGHGLTGIAVIQDAQAWLQSVQETHLKASGRGDMADPVPAPRAAP